MDRIPKDVGFPFRDWGVVAIGNNRKTQTRRMMHPQPPRGLTVGSISADGQVLEWILCDEDGDEVDEPCPKPRVEVGGRIYIKEAYQEFCPLWEGAWCGHGDEEGKKRDHYIVYRASNPDGALVWRGEVICCEGWQSATLMPRRCARYVRPVVAVRAQRVRDITRQDAIAEGCPQLVIDKYDPVHWFYSQWTGINGEATWRANFWVWAYTFAVGPTRPLPARTEYGGW